MAIRLVVGLGNPGEKYAGTRHNVGFRVADLFLDYCKESDPSAGWRNWLQGKGMVAKLRLSPDARVWAAKPLTYMNASGDFVRALADFHRIPPNSILVVSDDMDLPLGRIRIRKQGSSGGQKGLDSILSRLGTREVPRLRLGVGPRPREMDGAAFVLGHFSKRELPEAEKMLTRAVQAIRVVCAEGVDWAMNIYNAKASPE